MWSAPRPVPRHFPRPLSRHFFLAAIILIVAPTALPASAAPTEAGPDGVNIPTDNADTASKYLGSVYKDERAGIRIAPPAGSATVHGANLEIVSFVQPQKQWGGDVQEIILAKKTSVDDYLHTCVNALNKDFTGVQTLRFTDITFGGRKAGRLDTSMEGDITAPGAPKYAPKEKLALFRQQLLVQVEDNQFILLTFYTALKDRDEAAKTFDAMMGSFEIQDKQKLIKRQLQAVKAAKDWLARRTAEELKPKLLNDPQWYRMKVADKDIGWMRFVEGEQKRPEATGIEIAVDSRSIINGNFTLGKNNAFWAYSRDEKNVPRPAYSAWQNATMQRVPRPDHTVSNFWIEETGFLTEERGSAIDPATLEKLRQEREALIRNKDLDANDIPPPIENSKTQYHFIVTFRGDKSQGLDAAGSEIHAIIPDYRPAVLPKVLEYTWTRLVDLKKPSEMTFACFNSFTKKVALRTLAVVGPDRIFLDGKSIDCVRCTDEMDNNGTTLWVDSDSGRILKMLTSDQSLIEPTTEEKMKQLWGARLDG